MAEMHMTLTSPAFQEGQFIPTRHSCEAGDVSPELSWSHAPAETRSFGLIVDDPDAPSGVFTHWVLFDIPASVNHLAEGVSGVGKGGRNDFHHDRYGGPCPPPRHGAHRYFFTLYALDIDALGVSQGATRRDVERAMSGHVLAQTQLMGQYQRGGEVELAKGRG